MGDCRPLSPRLYGTVWGVGQSLVNSIEHRCPVKELSNHLAKIYEAVLEIVGKSRKWDEGPVMSLKPLFGGNNMCFGEKITHNAT